MREIKFRAWDKIGKRMGEVNYIKYSNVQYNQVSARFKQNEKTFDEWFNYGDKDGCDNIILMQYTGLKDRQGVEIYEGDVLDYDNGIGIKGIVKWYEDGFAIGILGAGDASNKSLYQSTEDIEVIGNIHENPELLKEGE